MKQKTTIAIHIVDERVNTILSVLIALIVAGVALYVYFLINTVVNTASRAQVERQIASLNSDIGEVESTYIKQESNITLNSAVTLGFLPAKNVMFVPRENTAVNVALR